MEQDVVLGDVVALREDVAGSRRLLSALEAVGFLVALLLYIWYFQAHARMTWTVLLAMLVASQMLHRESPNAMGIRWQGFLACSREYALPVLAVTIAGMGAGGLFRTLRPVPATHVIAVFVGYTWWALLQQYLLNAFFVNRLSSALAGRFEFVVPLLAGSFFAAAHLPNALLVNVTLVAGTFSAVAYRRHRNLLFLAVAHALLGTTIWFAIPDSVSHHLRVGPGMLEHQHIWSTHISRR